MGKSLVDGRYLYRGKAICHSLQPSPDLLIKITLNAVILDLTVPGGMGGKEVIRKLLEIDPNVKAIVSSGYSTDPIMSGFKEYGFSGVDAKPYNLEQMKKMLFSIIGKNG